MPDYAAALTAVQSESILPVFGVIAVCDFGASATTITLVDAGDGLRPIGEPLRCPEFGGDLIDRALLTHVLGAAGVGPDATRTWSIRALTTLRGECRSAKERLSTQTATTVPGAPAVRGSIRVTRPEVDELVRGPLAGVIGALRNNLQRNGIQPTDLAAVVAVGGTSAVPAVAATLSERLRVPIITAAHPGLAAATGAALRGSQQTRARRTSKEFGPEPAPRAWSQASDLPELVPQRTVRAQPRPPRPQLDFASPPVIPARLQWHRRPLVLAALVLAVVAGAGTATALALRSDTNAAPAGPPRTVVAVPAAHAGPAPVPAGSG